MSDDRTIKQITLDSLSVGMYIHDLNCGWLDHPFARSRFLVKDGKTLARIRKLPITTLYIDTSKGLDVAGAPTQEEVVCQQQQAIDELLDDKSADTPPPPRRSFDEERVVAAHISRDAHRVIGNILQGIKIGKQVRIEEAEAVVERMARSLVRNPDALIALGRIRSVDQYTFEHSINVCTLMVAFGHFLGLHMDTLRAIGTGAMLHDIGKVAISDKLLNKPGKLTEAEYQVMQTHVAEGEKLLADTGVCKVAAAVVMEHHERWDGSGYPKGLKGDEISYYGHMAALVDVYDALTSDRCYHHAMEPTEALRKIYAWSSNQFHPQLAQQFIRFIGIYPTGSFVELESGRLALVTDRGEDRLHPHVRVFYDTLLKRRVTTEDLDLARGGDQIKGYADPARWSLDAQQLLRQLI